MRHRAAPLALVLLAIACRPEVTPPPAIDWNEPPVRLEQQAWADTQRAWETHRGKGVRVHVRPGSAPARHVVALTRSADGALERAVDVIGGVPYTRPLDVFFFDTRDDLIAFAGIPATGLADSESSSVFLVWNPTWRAFDTHEIAHVVSIHTWGPPAEPVWWIREGLAVFADGRCRAHTVRDLAAEFLRRGTLPRAHDLLYEFASVGEMPGYLGGGSFVQFLYETFGSDAVRQVWQEGADALPTIAGMSLDELDQRWRSALATGPAIADDEWRAVMDLGCG